MNALLVHGMGRTPASMWRLGRCLTAAGIRPGTFGYSTVHSFRTVVTRLVGRVDALPRDVPFILVGHSLGAVLIRAALPSLGRPPAACFLLASPSCACRAARFFNRDPLFRLYTRDMGRTLADPEFFASLPVPSAPSRIYAGTGGFRGRRSPFRGEANDGILAVSETAVPSMPLVSVPAAHTFIMNSPIVARDIVDTVRGLPT
jgi:hypothetical protein